LKDKTMAKSTKPAAKTKSKLAAKTTAKAATTSVKRAAKTTAVSRPTVAKASAVKKVDPATTSNDNLAALMKRGHLRRLLGN
jgi:hypothetical protein